MKFSIFTTEKNLCILHGQVFIMIIDIETFIKSKKNTWIKRFIESHENGTLNKIYLNILNPYGGKLLFECNYCTKDADVFADGNTFLKDVLVFFFCSGVSRLFGAQGSPSSGNLLNLCPGF